MLDVRPTAGIPLQQIIWDIFMDFLSLIILVVIASLLWRISDQLPDVLFRLGEIQRDIADIRKTQADDSTTHESTAD